jgi:mono/diheme cytochrome c family protein
MDTICNMPRKQILAFFSFLFLSFIFSNNPLSAAAADGAKIFKQNCAVCHSLGDNKITGPGLAGIASRVPGGDWLHKWVKNNEKLIKSGDAYAVKISTFDASQMPVFESNLSEEEIDAVVAYIKNPPVTKKDDIGGNAAGGTSTVTQEEKGVNPMAVLIGVIAFLIILVGVLRAVRLYLQNLQNEKLGLPEEEAVGPWRELLNWINSHKRTTALIILIILCGILSSTWYALKDIGVYEGYHPEQPILFSHKIHAGDNAINCQYCHSGVERSKTAGIPSVNVCMNCHKGISTGPNIGSVEGTEEIKKIYAAAGWDPDKGEYNKPGHPIEWVKVHNLQDFVFFSHQQHVKVGKQDCANCHGDVKQMTTVQQVQPLTMGWCIDCHRKTEVPGMKDNPYYESLHKKLAEKFKNLPKEEQVITVAKMGGVECAKCHY